jgi:hypothetical protein
VISTRCSGPVAAGALAGCAAGVLAGCAAGAEAAATGAEAGEEAGGEADEEAGVEAAAAGAVAARGAEAAGPGADGVWAGAGRVKVAAAHASPQARAHPGRKCMRPILPDASRHGVPGAPGFPNFTFGRQRRSKRWRRVWPAGRRAAGLWPPECDR